MWKASRHDRAILAWFASGLLACHLALLVAVECFCPDIRDPEWAELVRRLQARRAEAPQRDLVVVLGSSRSLSAIDAGWLSRHTEGPLVFNASVPGAGPLLQGVLLERLLAEGVRPAHVVLEVMPAFFGDGGAILEESFLQARRLSAREFLQTVPLAQQPRRLLRPWSTARLQPLADLRVILQRRILPNELVCEEEAPIAEGRDGYGFHPLAPDEDRARLTRRLDGILRQYHRAMSAAKAGESRRETLHSILDRCQEEGCTVTLFVGPEHSRFRAMTSAWLHAQTRELFASVRQRGVTVFDARDWIPDEAFIDGHHVTGAGAREVSRRVEAELLGTGQLARR